MNVLSNKRKIFLIIAAIIAVGIVFFTKTGSNSNSNLNFKFSGDTLNLVTVILGVIGAWQIVASNINGMKDELASNINGMKDESEKRDQYHDQQLANLQVRIEILTTEQSQHQRSLGHDGTIGQILQIKDQLSDLRAALSVTTRQGEIFLKLDRLEKEIEELKANNS